MFSRLGRLFGWRADLAALVLGLLAAAALPPVNLLPVLLLSFPGLLVLVDEAPSPWVALRRGYWFGVGNYFAGLYWITDAIIVRAAEYWWLIPIAAPLIALGLAVFTAAPCGLARLGRPGWRRMVLFAGLWTLSDLAREFIFSGFPWNPLGSLWEAPGFVGDAFIQPAAWIGVHGLTLATVLLAVTPRLGVRAVASCAVILALWFSVGAWRLAQPVPLPPGVTLVLAQGNIRETEKQDHGAAPAAFQRYLDLTVQGVSAAKGEPSIVIWPESASPYLVGTDPGAREAITAAMRPARAALVGSLRFGPDNRLRNSLVTVLPSGAVGPVYDKAHLVPFGEYQPPFLPIQVVPGGGFEPGPGLQTLSIAGLPAAGPLICYEVIFPSEVVQRGRRPQWLVNITNDAWFGDTAGPRQHLAAARMRAVEEGLPLARAANTGISAVFDAFGREKARLGLNRMGVLVLPLPGALPATPYARLGLAIPASLAALCCIVALFCSRFTRRP